MIVSNFMTKRDDVVHIGEWDPVLKVIDACLDKKISAVVVLDKDEKPVGIVTKTDLVRAYQQGISLHQKVGVVMTTNVQTVLDTDSRDSAAKAFEKREVHHAIVVNTDGEFVGLISVWDIASECAKDSRAWPWNRTDDGRVQSPVH